MRSDELETTHYWRWNYGDLTWWNLKLKMLKTMGTPRKTNAILLNIKINRPTLVNICRYKLTTCWQNFTEIYLAWVKILQEGLGGLLFLTHTVHVLNTFFKSENWKVSAKRIYKWGSKVGKLCSQAVAKVNKVFVLIRKNFTDRWNNNSFI